MAAGRETLFAWLGDLRLALYRYDLLDNLGRRSPRRLDTSLPPLTAGQPVMSVFEAMRVHPPEELTIRARFDSDPTRSRARADASAGYTDHGDVGDATALGASP